MERLGVANPSWSQLVLSGAPGVIELPDLENVPQHQDGEGWRVVVFNNDHNTYAEVMTILMVATGCDQEEAYIETWEIDQIGQSVVHYGSEEECRTAGDIIAQIGIRVEVEPEP